MQRAYLDANVLIDIKNDARNQIAHMKAISDGQSEARIQLVVQKFKANAFFKLLAGANLTPVLSVETYCETINNNKEHFDSINEIITAHGIQIFGFAERLGAHPFKSFAEACQYAAYYEAIAIDYIRRFESWVGANLTTLPKSEAIRTFQAFRLIDFKNNEQITALIEDGACLCMTITEKRYFLYLSMLFSGFPTRENKFPISKNMKNISYDMLFVRDISCGQVMISSDRALCEKAIRITEYLNDRVVIYDLTKEIALIARENIDEMSCLQIAS